MSSDYLYQLVTEHPGIVAGTAIATALAAAWMSTSSDKPTIYPISLEDQSIEIEPGVRASRLTKNGELLEYYYDDARTTHEALTRGLKVSDNGSCIGTRKPGSKLYDWLSYQQIYDRANRLGSAFLEQGLEPKDTTFIGIYAPNCPEWVVAEEACAMFSMAYVPLYDTLGTDACEYIINQTEMSLLLCDKGTKAAMLVEAGNRMPSLKTIIVMAGPTLTEEVIEAGSRANINVFRFNEMLELGKEKLHSPVPPKPETLCTVCYTSGTTGNPKGVMLTHKALMANIAACIIHSNQECPISKDDVHLAYLPLAHMFERLNQLLMMQHGAKIGFSSGDIQLLIEDLAMLKPTIFPTVPRLLNRIYDKVQQGIGNSWIKTKLFNLACERKMQLLKRGIVTRNTIWDRLVFSKIQNSLGGRVRASATGSAPLAPKVLDFIRVALGCHVFEGYGQTEVTAGVSMTLPHDSEAGHVGPPLVCAHVKLVDIPEMDYYAKDRRGEICVRGPCVMSGYYKDPEKTKETIDEDGWVHSGDVGEWQQNGTLKIIDRKKHIFKLAQGEYIAPEKIEAAYIRCRYLAQVFVDGDSLQTYPVAIVIPDVEVVPDWAKNEFGVSGTMEDLCKNKVIKKAILDDLIRLGKETGLKGFEQVKDIYLTTEVFTVENGLLTPTFKSKRPAVRKYFSKQIEDMYNANQ